jgi:hypothetical protein
MHFGLRSVFSVSFVALTLAATPSLRADIVADLNKKAYGDIPEARRSDLVLLPLLAKSAPPPSNVGNYHEARLLLGGMKGWDQAAAWASAPAQQELIQALLRVGAERDFLKAFEFGMPYGFEGVSPDLIRAGLIVNLGDPPTIAAAQYSYLPALDRLEMLANVEASRLLSQDKTHAAIDIMIAMAHLGRQMCDRAMIREAQWGMEVLSRSMERVRDLAYRAVLDKKAIDVRLLATQIDRLDPEGFFKIGRMAMPTGDQIGATQVIERTRDNEVGGFNVPALASTMAKMGAGGKPLRLFSEAATWSDAAKKSAGPQAIQERVDGVYTDWRVRWAMNYFDSRLGNKTPYQDVDKDRYQLLVVAVPDMAPLERGRQAAETEIVGARTALACVGVYVTTNGQPNLITAVRPRWVKAIDADPFNADRAKPPLQYFVPRTSFEASIVEFTPSGKENFSVPLTGDTFVLYSHGSDNADAKARRIENTWEVVRGADYLIWPPVLSVFRQHLIDAGELE